MSNDYVKKVKETFGKSVAEKVEEAVELGSACFLGENEFDHIGQFHAHPNAWKRLGRRRELK